MGAICDLGKIPRAEPGAEQEVGDTQGKKNQSKEYASGTGGIEVRLLKTPPSQEDEP